VCLGVCREEWIAIRVLYSTTGDVKVVHGMPYEYYICAWDATPCILVCLVDLAYTRV
jgi:hypothetical protein